MKRDANAANVATRACCVLRGSLEQLARLRAFIAATAPQFGCGAEDVFALELACDEAVTNIFNHVFDDQTGEVQVELWRQGDAVCVTLDYYGRSFDPSQVAEPDLTAPLEQRPEGGLGLYFMRQLMQEVRFEFDAVKGNRLTMRRALAKN